jgi:arginine-tRNA-protein transferase
VSQETVFDSWMIEVRMGHKLIAVGVFDQGRNSIAGILNYYHPDFARLSPGKFLMLKKIEFAIQNGKEWYYPGYIAYDFPKFDYKVFAHRQSAEIFDPISKLWLPYSPELLSDLTHIQAPIFFNDQNMID